MSWIQKCLGLYGDVLERRSGKRWEPLGLEDKLKGARETGRIGRKELQDVEGGEYWPYPKWWDPPSAQFGEREWVRLVPDDEVKSLKDRIRNIEVVSIVLRFIFPEKFGIMSPPVIGLLNLGPGTDDDEQYYQRYLSELEKIKEHYDGLPHIADVDMALWVAAHLEWVDDKERAIRKEMQGDEWFQRIRLRNMIMDGLGRFWERTEAARLTLAEALLGRDHVLAALVATRPFESSLEQIAKQREIPVYRRDREGELQALVRTLNGHVPEVDLYQLKKYRNCAVHHFELTEEGRCSKCGMEKEDMARKFVPGVRQLYKLSGGCA